MKILLKYGPEHGHTITSDVTRGEVYCADGGYSYQLTEEEDD